MNFLSMSASRESERLEENVEEDPRIVDFRFQDNVLDIITEGETLRMIYEEGSLSFFDESGNRLAINNDNGEITFVDEEYAGYKINVDSKRGILAVNTYDNDELVLAMTEKSGFKMRGSGGVLGVTDYPDRLKFMDGYERLATSRGYLFSRSFPMLKDTLLIGYGPDTFVLEFPQQDYVGKMNAYGNVSLSWTNLTICSYRLV